MAIFVGDCNELNGGFQKGIILGIYKCDLFADVIKLYKDLKKRYPGLTRWALKPMTSSYKRQKRRHRGEDHMKMEAETEVM